MLMAVRFSRWPSGQVLSEAMPPQRGQWKTAPTLTI